MHQRDYFVVRACGYVQIVFHVYACACVCVCMCVRVCGTCSLGNWCHFYLYFIGYVKHFVLHLFFVSLEIKID